jgi:hypothetical protein
MQTATRPILFSAALLLCAPAFAGADIFKCTGADGHVTLTDRPCDGAAEATVLVAAAETAPAAVDRPARPYAAGVLLPRRQPAYKPVPPSRIMARDVATLKAARITMQLLDGPASRLQQRVAVFP